MSGRSRGEFQRFVRVRARFDAWRRTHVPHSRIPKSLWAAAVKLAVEFGISCTATRLKLNYYDLKRHVETTSPLVATRIPSFVELPAASLSTSSECTIELENTAGSKMRIQIKGAHCPDLVALSTAFCNVES